MQKEFKKLNLKELSRDTSSVDVARALGLKIYPKGRRNFICCPGHEMRLGKKDLNPTNAILTDYGYYCFACGVSVSTANMIVEVTGCSLHKAFEFMADLNGGTELYKEDNLGSYVPQITLSEAEMEALGLKQAYAGGMSFADVCRSAPDMAKEIIKERAAERLLRYEQMRERYETKEGALALYDFANVMREKRNKLLSELSERICTIKALEDRIGSR